MLLFEGLKSDVVGGVYGFQLPARRKKGCGRLKREKDGACQGQHTVFDAEDYRVPIDSIGRKCRNGKTRTSLELNRQDIGMDSPGLV